MELCCLPKTGLAGLKENWRSDLLSGFLVFLIALPLCLGISMASVFRHRQVLSLLLSVGAGFAHQRFFILLMVRRGLIVVVFGAVKELGEGDAMAGYRYALAAIVVASALQVLMGVLKRDV